MKSHYRLEISAFLLPVLLAGAACGGSSNQTPATGMMVLDVAGGSYERAYFASWIQPFQNATGIKVQTVLTDEPTAVQIQVSSGNVIWDAVDCTRSDALQHPNLYEPLDTSIVKTHYQLVTPEVFGSNYVATNMETFPVLAYSKKAFTGGGPQSWADFFDVQKFPGPRGLPNISESAWIAPLIALTADGVSADQMIPFDLNRAYKKLDTIKSSVRAFWSGFGQSQDIMHSGQVVMNVMTDGRALQLVNGGDPVGIAWSTGFTSIGAGCVVKGAHHRNEAWQFFNYILNHPQQEAIFASLTGYGPPTVEGVTAAQALGVADFSTLHAANLSPVAESPAMLTYLKDNLDSLGKRWNAWVTG